MPTRSTFLIAAFWALVIWGAIDGSSSPLHSNFRGEMTTATTVTILSMPLLFCAMTFWMPAQSPFYNATIARFIDARFGEGAFSDFLVRLKPILMFAAAASIQGTLGLWQSSTSGQGSGANTIYGFFISAGVGFAIAHTILYYRRAVGVYPSRNAPLTASQRQQPLPLRDALRRYWWTLVGLAAFPTVVFTVGDLYQVPFEYFALPFFAVGLLAGWPYFSGRAPFSFCLVLGIVWLAAGLVGALVALAARAFVAGG